MVHVGIDPGVHTGIAAWNAKTKEFSVVETTHIFIAMDILKALIYEHGVSNVHVHCENPNTWRHFSGTSASKIASKAQGAGSVKRDFSIWKAYCEHIGVEFTPVSLTAALKKIDALRFQKYTGIRKRTSEHARDAAMIVLNKK